MLFIFYPQAKRDYAWHWAFELGFLLHCGALVQTLLHQSVSFFLFLGCGALASV
jgi:hypothetical protein